MDIFEAVSSSRFHHQWLPDNISVESNSIELTVQEHLQSLGYDLVNRGAIGRVNAIMAVPGGLLAGAADTRGNNVATGF